MSIKCDSLIIDRRNKTRATVSRDTDEKEALKCLIGKRPTCEHFYERLFSLLSSVVEIVRVQGDFRDSFEPDAREQKCDPQDLFTNIPCLVARVVLDYGSEFFFQFSSRYRPKLLH